MADQRPPLTDTLFLLQLHIYLWPRVLPFKTSASYFHLRYGTRHFLNHHPHHLVLDSPP